VNNGAGLSSVVVIEDRIQRNGVGVGRGRAGLPNEMSVVVLAGDLDNEAEAAKGTGVTRRENDSGDRLQGGSVLQGVGALGIGVIAGCPNGIQSVSRATYRYVAVVIGQRGTVEATPTDNVAPLAPIEVEEKVRRGSDAVNTVVVGATGNARDIGWAVIRVVLAVLGRITQVTSPANYNIVPTRVVCGILWNALNASSRTLPVSRTYLAGNSRLAGIVVWAPHSGAVRDWE
jgi:hypothetical protein